MFMDPPSHGEKPRAKRRIFLRGFKKFPKLRFKQIVQKKDDKNIVFRRKRRWFQGFLHPRPRRGGGSGPSLGGESNSPLCKSNAHLAPQVYGKGSV